MPEKHLIQDGNYSEDISNRIVSNTKLHALGLRFTEGPRNNPSQLPTDLFSGREAFQTCHRTTSGSHYFSAGTKKDEILSPTPEKQVVETLVEQFIKKQQEFVHLAQIIQSQLLIRSRSTNEGKNISILHKAEILLKTIVNELTCIQQKIQAEKTVLEKRITRIKHHVGELCVEQHSGLRELERQELAELSKTFSFEALCYTKKTPPFNQLSFPSIHTASPAAGPQQRYFPLPLPRVIAQLVAEVNGKRFSDIPEPGNNTENQEFFNTDYLPPSILGQTIDPATAELTLALHLSRNCSLDTTNKGIQDKEQYKGNDLLVNKKITHEDINAWKQSRIERITRKAKKSWGEYSFGIKRLRRFMDEQASPYRYFPLLKHDKSIRLLNMLGKGGFAEVWQGLHLDTLEKSAIKIIELHADATPEEQEFILASTCREVTLQRSLKHPHVVEMQQCFEITSSIFVASLDLCNGGSLDNYIYQYGPVSEKLAKVWMRQILLALEYIHTVGKVVHFDLKPLNILLHNFSIKIADFGLHQPVGSKGTAALDMTEEYNQIGTVWYMPPEHLKAALLQETSEFDGRFDVWAAGVVLYEMLYQRRPFGNSANMKGFTCHHVAAAVYSDFMAGKLEFPVYEQNYVSDSCKKFIRRLLQDVGHRPTTTEALKDVFFSS